jgi:hypothetical protein
VITDWSFQRNWFDHRGDPTGGDSRSVKRGIANPLEVDITGKIDIELWLIKTLCYRPMKCGSVWWTSNPFPFLAIIRFSLHSSSAWKNWRTCRHLTCDGRVVWWTSLLSSGFHTSTQAIRRDSDSIVLLEMDFLTVWNAMETTEVLNQSQDLWISWNWEIPVSTKWSEETRGPHSGESGLSGNCVPDRKFTLKWRFYQIWELAHHNIRLRISANLRILCFCSGK